MTILSVVMPVYNADKYLDDSILSILGQTYFDFKFYIINDGSIIKSGSPSEIISDDTVKSVYLGTSFNI